jgi:hypothetical protein
VAEGNPEIAAVMANCPPGMVTIGWGPTGAANKAGIVPNTVPQRGKRHPKTIENRAATLRQKLRAMQKDPEGSNWLSVMVQVFDAAYGGDIVKAQRLAKTVGETSFSEIGFKAVENSR